MRLDHAGKIQSASLISAADEEEEGEGVQSLEEATASLQIFTFLPPTKIRTEALVISMLLNRSLPIFFLFPDDDTTRREGPDS